MMAIPSATQRAEPPRRVEFTMRIQVRSAFRTTGDIFNGFGDVVVRIGSEEKRRYSANELEQ
jgi:hypothetical protein